MRHWWTWIAIVFSHSASNKITNPIPLLQEWDWVPHAMRKALIQSLNFNGTSARLSYRSSLFAAFTQYPPCTFHMSLPTSHAWSPHMAYPNLAQFFNSKIKSPSLHYYYLSFISYFHDLSLKVIFSFDPLATWQVTSLVQSNCDGTKLLRKAECNWWKVRRPMSSNMLSVGYIGS